MKCTEGQQFVAIDTFFALAPRLDLYKYMALMYALWMNDISVL